MKKKILVTSALPYVNNLPHLGTMICILSADVYTRFLRLKKEDVVSVLGTDEHGTTTETKAIEEGLTPTQITDKYYKSHKQVYDWFLCDFSCFGRTSSKENYEISQEIFKRLYKNGYIFNKKVEQAYCEKCKKFLADRYVEGVCPYCNYDEARGDQCEKCGKLLNPEELKKPKCKICGSTPIIKETEHLFVDLPKLAPELKKWMKTREQNWSLNAKAMTESWLKEGLKPRCITRDIKWGIPVPLKGFENKVFYSWFDAPIGYISITKECRKDWKKWWHDDSNVKLVQFMGKDNIPFHTILFPSFLIGSKGNYTLLDTISVNEYLNYEGGMFSKSRNIGVFGDDAQDTGIRADVWRYYMMINRPEKADTEFIWEDFQQKINNELVGNLGNLVNRTFTFLNRYFDSKIPKLTKKEIKADYEKIEKLYGEIELKKALKEIMFVSDLGNQYFQKNEPWKQKEKAGNVLANLALLVKDISILIYPYMPKISEEIWGMMNLKKQEWKDLGSKVEGKIKKAKLLFNKLEDEDVAKFKKKYAGGRKMSNFANLNLKVAKVLDVEEHPNADKLMILKIDLGKEKRQIVAGLAEYYKAEELKDKKIVVVSNLEYAKLRGVESQGMLLAGEDADKNVKLLYVEKSNPGEQVYIEGVKPQNKKISFDDFLKTKIEIKDSKVLSDNKELRTDKEKVKIEKIKNGVVR
jgi:methionyl-tRNA synthetase